MTADGSLDGRSDPLAILDWRRRVAALYAQVRASDDPAGAHAQWRAGRQQLLGGHPASPVPPEQRSAFPEVDYGRYDTAYRFEVAVDRDAEPLAWEVPTGTDGVVAFTRCGVLRLPGIGRLDLWRLRGYAGGVFLPVKDAAAGRRTYGGGRYVLDTVKGADLGGDAAAGRLVVDLNFAYAPSCAYDPMWACPLAPPGDVLDVPVEVGELLAATTSRSAG